MGGNVKEFNIQKVIVQYLRAHNYITIDTDIPNALRFFKTQGQRLAYISERKSMGWTKGTSDLIAIGHGDILFIELKRPKGKQSPEQVVFQKEMVSRGFNYVVVRSLEDIEKVIEYSNLGEE